MKKIISLSLCVILLMSLTSCWGLKSVETLFASAVTNDDISKYEEFRMEVPFAKEYMPAIDSLEGYTEISCSYQLTLMIFFESRSLCLYVEYPEEIYEEKKEEAMSSYEFIDETVLYKSQYYSAPAEFKYGSYHLQTVATDFLVKKVAFIGFNDEMSRIAYCYFHDYDLDTFGTAEISEQEMITDFIDEFFYWNDNK